MYCVTFPASLPVILLTGGSSAQSTLSVKVDILAKTLNLICTTECQNLSHARLRVKRLLVSSGSAAQQQQ